MTKYSAGRLHELIESVGGEWDRRYAMDEMERLRTGANRLFREPNSRWVEVAAIRL